jgi:aspartate aminotransferase-like enzyme
MRRRVLGLSLCAMLFALCVSVDAQQPGKIFRIGVLNGSTASSIAGLLEAFRRELSKLGWNEGKKGRIG